MLRLKHIQLVQFKNHLQASFGLPAKVIAIAGSNGSGKTNLLDAIYYLCFTKSYINSSDLVLPTNGSQGFRVQGSFELNGEEAKVAAVLRENSRREHYWNDEMYKSRAQHIGRLPAVFIGPDDVELITGSSELRRKMIDALLCQVDGIYLQQLLTYNKLLQQRNSLLKQMQENPSGDKSLLEILTGQMIKPAYYISLQRHNLMKEFIPAAENHYAQIAGAGNETVQLKWQSQFVINEQVIAEAEMQKVMLNNLQKDMVLQRTNIGVHKDDLLMMLNDQPFKVPASQGQRKSLLFALKLTEFEWLQKQKGFAPILLLDDVFEKLDAARMQNLLREVCLQKEGQVIITDTHAKRLTENLTAIGADFVLLHTS